MRLLFSIFLLALIGINAHSQNVVTIGDSAAQGFRFRGANNSFEGHLYGFLHFHSKFTGDYRQQFRAGNDFRFNMSRVRVGMEGFLLRKEFRYHLQFGLGGPEIYTDPTSPISGYNGLLDAFVEYDVFKNFTISFGQRFVPGHRESFIGMANVQFIDRSLLFTFSGHDRDAGIFMWYKLGKNDFIIKPQFAVTGGKGRNTAFLGLGGLNFNFRTDIYLNGAPNNLGEYIIPDYEKEEVPRIIIGFGGNYNHSTPRVGGFTGEFLKENMEMIGFFSDLFIKYKGLSFLAEVYHRRANYLSPFTFGLDNMIGPITNGIGFNIQAGYFLNRKNEIIARHTNISINSVLQRNDALDFTIGWNRYLSGKNFKFQTLASFDYQSFPRRENLVLWLNTVFGF